MKHTRHIFQLILLTLAAVSCGKDEPVIDNGQNVILDWPGFIWFDSGVGTKTTAIENNLYGKSFNVIAFKYGSDWTTFKATGTPASAMGVKGFRFPTTVSCASDGVCSYVGYNNSTGNNITTPVEWEGTMKYSFFAYYPASVAGTVELVTGDGTAGVPAIKYTVPDPEAPVAPETVGYMDATKVPDVMTAYTTDAQNRGETGVVSLNFKHRLCLFCVEARNLKEADATISDLVLTITSNRYGDVTIPLDGSPLQPGTIINDNFACRMQPTGASVTVPQFGKDGTSNNTLVSYPDNHIAFIPQDPTIIGEVLSGKLTFKWDGAEREQEFSSTKVFNEGTKYSFVITIASNDAISIDIYDSNGWEEESNDIIFE